MVKTSSTPDTQTSDAEVGSPHISNDILVDSAAWEDSFAVGNSWEIFQFQAADLDNGIDEINDFSLNTRVSSSNVVDVGDVLSDTANDGHLGGYLHFTVTDAANGIVTLGVDANGSQSGGDYTTLATIAIPNISLSASATSSEILNTLLQYHEIKF